LKDQIDSGSYNLEIKILGLVDLDETQANAFFKLTVACPQSYKSRDQKEFHLERDLLYKGDKHRVYRPSNKESFLFLIQKDTSQVMRRTDTEKRVSFTLFQVVNSKYDEGIKTEKNMGSGYFVI